MSASIRRKAKPLAKLLRMGEGWRFLEKTTSFIEDVKRARDEGPLTTARLETDLSLLVVNRLASCYLEKRGGVKHQHQIN